MKEYTKLENQTEQGFEATTRQVEERNDDNEENHQTIDEPRKRKMGADEARAGYQVLIIKILSNSNL